MSRAQNFYARAVEIFGPIATDPRGRILRLLEEAIELAGATGTECYATEAMVRRSRICAVHAYLGNGCGEF